MSPSIYIVEVIKNLLCPTVGMWFFSLFLISHFYWQHPWAGFRDGAEGADAPNPHLL